MALAFAKKIITELMELVESALLTIPIIPSIKAVWSAVLKMRSLIAAFAGASLGITKYKINVAVVPSELPIIPSGEDAGPFVALISSLSLMAINVLAWKAISKIKMATVRVSALSPPVEWMNTSTSKALFVSAWKDICEFMEFANRSSIALTLGNIGMVKVVFASMDTFITL